MAAPDPARIDTTGHRKLLVDADLDMTVDGRSVTLRGDGSRLVVDVEDTQTAWKLFQSNRPGRHLVRTITDTLEQFGIDVDVRVGDRTVATVGSDANPGPVSRAISRAVGAEGVAFSAPELPRRARWGLVGLAFALGAAVGSRR